jgi:hypothetical protein
MRSIGGCVLASRNRSIRLWRKETELIIIGQLEPGFKISEDCFTTVTTSDLALRLPNLDPNIIKPEGYRREWSLAHALVWAAGFKTHEPNKPQLVAKLEEVARKNKRLISNTQTPTNNRSQEDLGAFPGLVEKARVELIESADVVFAINVIAASDWRQVALRSSDVILLEGREKGIKDIYARRGKKPVMWENYFGDELEVTIAPMAGYE